MLECLARQDWLPAGSIHAVAMQSRSRSARFQVFVSVWAAFKEAKVGVVRRALKLSLGHLRRSVFGGRAEGMYTDASFEGTKERRSTQCGGCIAEVAGPACLYAESLELSSYG